MNNTLSVFQANGRVQLAGAGTDGLKAFSAFANREEFLAGAGDAGMDAADQLRKNALSNKCLDFVPKGDSRYHGSAKVSIFSRDLGEATVHRTPDEIDVNMSAGSVAIKPDPKDPENRILITSATGNSTGVIKEDGNGFIATTDDGHELSIHNSGHGFEVSMHGFQGIPNSAKISLNRV